MDNNEMHNLDEKSIAMFALILLIIVSVTALPMFLLFGLNLTYILVILGITAVVVIVMSIILPKWWSKILYGKIFRIIAIIYIIFSLIYGLVFISVDLSGTIDFQGDAEAITASRQTQLCICIPFIVLGILCLILLVIYYLSRRKQNLKYCKPYGITVSILGAVLAIISLVIAIWKAQTVLIICIIAAFCILLYGLFCIRAHKITKSHNNYIKN